jgi:site-specific DNA-methyltransferase (adenine-specific)
MKRDVLEYKRDTQVGHPAQKPVSLLIDLLRRSAKPGDRVLDPFMGSGSTIMACDELKLPCTGIEMDEAAFGIAAKRLKSEADTTKELFDAPF